MHCELSVGLNSGSSLGIGQVGFKAPARYVKVEVRAYLI